MCYSCSSELYRGNLKIALKKFQAVVLASIYTTLLFMESLVVRGFGVFVCFFKGYILQILLRVIIWVTK